MKKILSLAISLVILTNIPVFGQKDKNPNSNGNSDKGRVNLLLPHGNIGINTLNPSERLEVVGNVRVSNTIYAQNLNVVGLSSNNMSVNENIEVGNNLLINGNVGIGISNPTDRLEINGNLRVSHGIFSDMLEANTFTANDGTINQDLSINQNLTVEGLTGLGISSPLERLEVKGNIKASENLISTGLQTQTGNFSSTVEMEENLIVKGNIGLGIDHPTERMEVDGNLRVSNSIFSDILEANTFTANDGTINQNLHIKQDLNVEGLMGLGISSPLERLEVKGNIKASENLISTGLQTQTGSFSSKVEMEDNLIIKGNIGLGIDHPTERMEVDGNLKVSNRISSQFYEGTTLLIENATIDNQLTISGKLGVGVAAPTEQLEVAGNMKATGNFTAADLFVNQGNFEGNVNVSKNFGVSGTSNFTGAVTANAFTAHDGTINQNLHIKQGLNVEGLTGLGISSPLERLEVKGNIKASEKLISTGLQTQTGSFSSKVEMEDNLIVKGNIGLGIDHPTERMEVDGNLKVSNRISSQSYEGTTLLIENATIDNRLTISGKLGVGVAAPAEQLEVAGNIKATGNFTAANLFVNQGNFEGNVNVSKNFGVSGTSNFTGAVTTGDLTVLNRLDLKNSLTLGGNLGIGVITPSTALHVAGDGRFEGNITAVKLIVQELEVANLNWGSQEGGQVSFNDNLFVEGSVGIGTEQIEGYALSVNGKIRASDDIKVYPSTEWADFVFDEGYDLRSLREVEVYIAKHKHLPDIPSAEEVKEEGISLGEMDARLLQKVEELTLYMIALKKENDQLKTEMKMIKDKVMVER